MDTGHVKQVASFEMLIGFCSAHGSSFNPSKAALQTASLRALLTSAQQSLETVRAARIEYTNAMHERREAFQSLPKFMTRMVNALAATEASDATVEEAYVIIRKFYRMKRKTVAQSGMEGSNPSAIRRVSELDFDSMAANFEMLVNIVSQEPSYQPNEVELQVPSIKDRATELHRLNQEVVTKLVICSNMRASRNKLLYDRSGIYGLAHAAKCYMKGVFGFQSVAYNQIKSLRFINYGMSYFRFRKSNLLVVP